MTSSDKTLVVFDTNKLRQTLKGGPAYGSFDFGVEFNKVRDFIDNKNLQNVIEIAIPDISMQELIQQKVEQHSSDVKIFKEMSARIKELPNVSFDGVQLPPDDFDCEAYLMPFVDALVSSGKFKKIKLGEDEYSDVYKKSIKRALKRIPPFKSGNKSSDIGFKDVVLWESLLRYDDISNYAKVILLTEDKGFDNPQCKEEFEEKKKRSFMVIPSVEYVLTELTDDYTDLIEKQDLLKFANNQYFKDYINSELSKWHEITTHGEEWDIKDKNVVEYCDGCEFVGEDESSYWASITSKIQLTIEKDSEEKVMEVQVKTYIDDTKGIQKSEIEKEDSE